MIPDVLDQMPEDSDSFLIALLNQLQTDWKEEVDYKNGKNKVPNHSDVLNVTCDAMYKEMNDSRFTPKIVGHPEINYEQQLINFCHNVKALKYGDDKL